MIQKKARLAARQVVGIQGGEGVLGERLLWVAVSIGRRNTCVTPLSWGLDPPVQGQLVINRRLRVRQMLAHSTLAPLLASSGPSTPPSIPR